METGCDLHTHSLFSDGTCAPEELVQLAEGMGLSHVALTDHNTVLGLDRFLQAAQHTSVQAVPGVELSCGWGGREIHMLGLFLQPCHFHKVHEYVQAMHRKKDESNRQLVEKLQEAGYALSFEELTKCTPEGHFNRAHVAKAMLEKGYVRSVEEAVKGILSPAYGLYRPPERLDALEAIRFLRSICAVPVLAHPYLNQSADELAVFVPRAKEAGLIGMEVRYPLFDRETEEAAARLAKAHHLLPSGGSDFHGAIKPHIALGTGTGKLFVPSDYAVALSVCAQKTAR